MMHFPTQYLRLINNGIPNSNTLYKKYELELFVIISYDKAIKEKVIKEARRDFLLKINHTAMRERYDG
jgi:hypothetical protein